jgi:hypothetical protein
MRLGSLLVVVAIGWSWSRKRKRSKASVDDVRAGSTNVDGGEIVDGTVEELLKAVQGLLKDESDRATSLNARASGLTGFIGIILSVAAAAVAALGADAGAGLHEWVRIGVGILIALALGTLVAAVIAVVAKVLLPTEGFTIATSEVEAYPTWDFISRERVMVQGHLMRGYVKALERDRARHASKATWLGRGYKLVCVGLVLVAIAGTAATLDRYVAGGSNEPTPKRHRHPSRDTTRAGPRGGEPLHDGRARGALQIAGQDFFAGRRR